MLKKFFITLILFVILSRSFATYAESQSLTVVDAKCKADYIASCSAALRADFIKIKTYDIFKKNYGSDFKCLNGYSFQAPLIFDDVLTGTTDVSCIIKDEIAAKQSDISVCEAREYRDLPQNCYRFVDVVKLDQIHTSLTSDMRVLLAQFCKTYAKDTEKCAEVLNSNEKK